MLEVLTEKEIKINQMRAQLIYIESKRSLNYKLGIYQDEIENEIYQATDKEILKRYRIHENEILKEQWVDVYPMFYHITYFEDVLDEQINECFDDQNCTKGMERFYNSIKKSDTDFLTLEEKIKLFWITHPVTY
jgi:hypothetical protein